MRKEELKIFLNRRVELLLGNSFVYKGIITKLNTESLILDDRFKGEMVISLDAIAKVESADKNKGGGKNE